MIRTASSVPWFIQTDACYEMQSGDVVAGIGAVLFDQNGKAVRFFSHKISDAVVEFLNPGLARKQPSSSVNSLRPSVHFGCGGRWSTVQLYCIRTMESGTL